MQFPYRQWHLLAAGGVGMSALAKVLAHFGCRVSGSDVRDSRELDRLRKAGILVSVGHTPQLPPGTEAVVYSSAIRSGNPEIWAARSRGIPIYHRAEILADLLHQSTSVGVTGTHGKTTTSACVSFILEKLGLKPTCLVGGDIRNVGDNVILGSTDVMVSEIDESDQTQELIRPDIAVITNIEPDHLDHYVDFQGLMTSFRRYLSGIRDRTIVFSGEDKNLVHMITGELRAPITLTYGIGRGYDCAAVDICLEGFGARFILEFKGRKIGCVKTQIPGLHNIRNILAAVAACSSLALRPEEMIPAIESFFGAGRRLEVLFKNDDLMVIDDYAHHPTEVSAGIEALKGLGRPISVIYQPHRYSRTQLMGDSFAECFEGAARVLITDIYAADEDPRNKVTSDVILKSVKAKSGVESQYIPRERLLGFLTERRIPGEVMAFLGAGDIGEIAHAFSHQQTKMPDGERTALAAQQF